VSIPKIRTPARVSRQIPLKTPARSSLLVVTHPDHVCIALSIGHGKSGHRLSALSLDNASRDALLAALLDWRYLPELPDADTTVLIALDSDETDELLLGYYDGDGRWCAHESGGPVTIPWFIRGWAYAPVAPVLQP